MWDWNCRSSARNRAGNPVSSAASQYSVGARFASPENEASFVEALLARYAARIPDAAKFVLRSRVLLLNSPTGIGIDISMGALPFEQLVVERASHFEFAPGLELRTCSAEDLMVMKLFASRAIDIRDAEGIAVRHDKTLDWRYIEEQLIPLAEAKEEPEILKQFARIRGLNSTL
jgi:hypothetical protein